MRTQRRRQTDSQTDSQTDRRDESDSRFSRFFQSAHKIAGILMPGSSYRPQNSVSRYPLTRVSQSSRDEQRWSVVRTEQTALHLALLKLLQLQ